MSIREKLAAKKTVYPPDYWQNFQKKHLRIMWGCLTSLVSSFIVSLIVNIWVLFQIGGNP